MIDQGRAKQSELLPAPRRSDDRYRRNGDLTNPAQAPDEFKILENWKVGEPPHGPESARPQKNGLITVRKPQSSGPPIGNSFDPAQPGRKIIDVKLKSARGHIRPAEKAADVLRKSGTESRISV